MNHTLLFLQIRYPSNSYSNLWVMGILPSFITALQTSFLPQPCYFSFFFNCCLYFLKIRCPLTLSAHCLNLLKSIFIPRKLFVQYLVVVCPPYHHLHFLSIHSCHLNPLPTTSLFFPHNLLRHSEYASPSHLPQPALHQNTLVSSRLLCF